MKTYFFVPANRLNKITQIKDLNVDEIIIDLEDAIKSSEVKGYIERLSGNETYKSHYLRLSIHNENLDLYLENFNKLTNKGFTRFVIPKVQDKQQFKTFLKLIDKVKTQLILLIETPKILVDLQSILETYSSTICGIGIGSHDLLNLVGARHTIENLEYIRQTVLYNAKAYNLEAIDFASMTINNEESFIKELNDGLEKGYDAKFFIHPWQVECFKKLNYYSEEDFKWAIAIYNELKKINFEINEFNAIKIGNQIIEKPHIKRAIQIVNYFNNRK